MRMLVAALIDWPARVAAHFRWLGPLIARLVVGYVFLLSGWGKLQNLPLVTKNFIDWGIPLPHVLTPFVSGLEFVGGVLLLVGLLTRFAGGALAVVMVVAVKSALWDQVDSLETLLGFEETAYFAIFAWLAIAGPGALSVDALLQRLTSSRNDKAAARAASA
ncbi:MAG: DoxX family protein [Rhodanobacteraceae bacterium]